MDKNKFRQFIREALNETVNNFLDKEKEAITKQLDDNSDPQVLGDPISDVKLNQNAKNLGSDSKIALQ